MKFIIEYYIDELHGFVVHSSHTSYNAAKREINAGWSFNKTRRLKVVDERILYKVKAGKYMVDYDSSPKKHIKSFK